MCLQQTCARQLVCDVSESDNYRQQSALGYLTRHSVILRSDVNEMKRHSTHRLFNTSVHSKRVSDHPDKNVLRSKKHNHIEQAVVGAFATGVPCHIGGSIYKSYATDYSVVTSVQA